MADEDGDVVDLSVEILQQIRGELQTLNARVDAGFKGLEARFDTLEHETMRVDALERR